MRTVGVCLTCPGCAWATESVRLELGSVRSDLIRDAFRAFADAAELRPFWGAGGRPHCPRCGSRLRLVRTEIGASERARLTSRGAV